MSEELTPGDDELVPVADFRDSVHAQLCQMALQAGGVEAWLSQPTLAGVAPDLGIALGVEVLVRASSVAVARELTGALEAGDMAIPPEATACPRCGSTEAQYLPQAQRGQGILGGVFRRAPEEDVVWAWKCSRCGNDWP